MEQHGPAIRASLDSLVKGARTAPAAAEAPKPSRWAVLPGTDRAKKARESRQRLKPLMQRLRGQLESAFLELDRDFTCQSLLIPKSRCSYLIIPRLDPGLVHSHHVG